MSIETLRPTTDVDGGASSLFGLAGTIIASTAMASSYDASGLSTSSTQSTVGTLSLTRLKQRIFKTWETKTKTYTALTLSVNTASTGAAGSGGMAGIYYSLNAGSTWTVIREDFLAWAQVTDTITLSAGQDLTQVQVGIGVEGDVDNGIDGIGSDQIQVWDIWTSGTYVPGRSFSLGIIGL